MSERSRLSQFMIGDLALRSAYELERALSDMEFDPDPLRELAAALDRSSEIGHEQGDAIYMRPGYFEPLETVYLVHHSADTDTPKLVRAFVKDATEKLMSIADRRSGVEDKALVDLCLELHRAFIRRVVPKEKNEQSYRGIPLEAGFC